MDSLKLAIDSFIQVVGVENVITDPKILSHYEKTTFLTGHRIPAIVRPAHVGEVQDCVRLANQHKTPVYVISTGENTGYGSKVPTQDGCIVIELNRMDRIVDFNDELGYITLEPGVTQKQLYEFLLAKHCKFWMDTTGATEKHSLIGNIIERGFGHTPYGDHFANVAGLEVVLPDGDRMHTGFGRFSNAKAKQIYRWGVGPYFDGIFSQSNLGIVTQLSVWLMPKPEFFQAFYFKTPKYEQLLEVIDALRPLRLNKTIKSALHIGNDYKVLSSIQTYPWELMQGKTPLSQAVLDDLAKQLDFGAWNGSGALYGTRQEVASARAQIKKQLKGKVSKLLFLDDRLLRLAELMQKPYQWLTGVNLPQVFKLLKPLYLMNKGVPSDAMIPSVYWRKKQPAVMNDPERDGCGLMWLAPTAPISGEHADAIWQIVSGIFAKYEFEPAVSITLITERAMDCVISISYDREIPGEDQRALQCHDELLEKLTEAGYFPYRLGIQSMGKLPKAEEAYLKFMASIKKSLDPNGILAPGRYEA